MRHTSTTGSQTSCPQRQVIDCFQLRQKAGSSYWARRQQTLESVQREVINIGLVESNTTLDDNNIIAEKPDGGEEKNIKEKKTVHEEKSLRADWKERSETESWVIIHHVHTERETTAHQQPPTDMWRCDWKPPTTVNRTTHSHTHTQTRPVHNLN